MRVSHETICHEIHTRHDLHFVMQCLPQSRPKRRKRGQGKTHREPRISNQVSVERRPEHIEECVKPRHWEADTFFGKNQDSSLVTLVERSARLLCAAQVLSKHADVVARTINKMLIDLPASLLKTITFNNGTEFAAKLNNRQRKCLNARTPNEVLQNNDKIIYLHLELGFVLGL